tara:strand:- start:82 stop:459 length:378 start_codon:yes stop_codon:yes gene_type:complete
MAAKKQAKGRAKGLPKLDRRVRKIVTRLDKLDKHDAKAKAHNKKVAKKGSSQTKGRAKVALSTDKIVAARVNKIHKSIRKAATIANNDRKGRARKASGPEKSMIVSAGAKKKKAKARMSRPQRMK